MKTKSIKKNFIWNTILKLSSIVFPLIIFPYVSRIIGASGIGKVSFATSVISYYSIIAQLGVQTYGIRSCAQVKDNPQELSKRVQEILIINIISTIVAYVALFISIALVPRFQSEEALLLITSLEMAFNTIGVVWLFSGLEQYSYITIRSVIFKLISLILIFIFVKNKSDYIIYGSILVVADVGSNIFNFIYSRKFVSYRKTQKYNLRRHLKPIFTFLLMSVASSVYTQLDTIMLGFMTTDTIVGYYNAALKIRSVLLGIVNSLAVVMLPRSAYYVENNELDMFLKLSRKAYNFIVIIGLSFWIYFSIFARESILFISGSDFVNATFPMLCIMPTVLICGISNLTAIQMLVSLNKEKIVLISQIIGAAIDFTLNLIMIPMLGASGAALATMIAEFIILLIQIHALHKENITISPGTQHGKIIFANLCAIIACLWVKRVSLIPFLSLIVSAILYFGVYGLVLCALKEKITYYEIVTPFIKKLKIKKKTR